jgi:hypothetical protein
VGSRKIAPLILEPRLNGDEGSKSRPGHSAFGGRLDGPQNRSGRFGREKYLVHTGI